MNTPVRRKNLREVYHKKTLSARSSLLHHEMIPKEPLHSNAKDTQTGTFMHRGITGILIGAYAHHHGGHSGHHRNGNWGKKWDLHRPRPNQLSGRGLGV